MSRVGPCIRDATIGEDASTVRTGHAIVVKLVGDPALLPQEQAEIEAQRRAFERNPRTWRREEVLGNPKPGPARQGARTFGSDKNVRAPIIHLDDFGKNVSCEPRTACDFFA